MLARVHSMGFVGIEGRPVTVEVDISPGMPAYFLVGLPDAAVKESRERVQTALGNAGYAPKASRTTVSLAPADMRKSGPCYDLPIAIGMLVARGVIEQRAVEGAVFMGELALDGAVNPVAGVLPAVIAAREAGYKRVFAPEHNAREGACIPGIEVMPVKHLKQLVSFLTDGGERIEPQQYERSASHAEDDNADLRFVQGQRAAKRALEIAAAGAHNIILIGPPGSGKTMLARCLPSILPGMTFEESLEVTRIHSIAGMLPPGGGLLTARPFRAPHHTASTPALVGGGVNAMPGEVSKANNGVLFLDELPEHTRTVKEALRQPLEDGMVTVTRVGAQITYPARFMLVAAMNPCPCGNYGARGRTCRCAPGEIHRYLGRVSGPLLDRLDIHIEVEPLPVAELTQAAEGEPSAEVRQRVTTARALQQQRYRDERIFANAQLNAPLMRKYCMTTPEARELLEMSASRLSLSARAYTRILKVARTIADIEGAKIIDGEHIAEAVQYRSLDRKYWRA